MDVRLNHSIVTKGNVTGLLRDWRRCAWWPSRE